MSVREKLIDILKQAPFEDKVLDEWWWKEKKLYIQVDLRSPNGFSAEIMEKNFKR